MLKAIMTLYHKAKEKILANESTVKNLITSEVKDKISKLRFTPESQIEQIKEFINTL
jgi:hypothetical protein